MASFEDLFNGYGMSPGLGGGFGGGGGFNNSLVGMGLGLLSPGGQGWENAMKGFTAGAATDARSRDRQAALYQAARDRAEARAMQRERMGQQQSQWQSEFDYRKGRDKERGELADKEQVRYLPMGEDEDENKIYREVFYNPRTGISRLGRTIKGLERGEEGEEVAPAVPAGPAPSGGGLAEQLGAPGQVPQVRQQLLDEAPASTNVEDRTQAAAPAAPTASAGYQEFKAKLQAQGVRGKQLREALTSYLKHMGNVEADVAAGKLTEQQAKGTGFATVMELQQEELGKDGDLVGAGTLSGAYGRMTERLPDEARGTFMTKAYQKYSTAKHAWTEAMIRQNSGAAVPPEEIVRYGRIYFPLPGEDRETIEQKRRLRAAATDYMKKIAGPSYVSPDKVLAEARAATGGGGQKYPFAGQTEPEQTPENNPNVPLPESALKTTARWAAQNLPRVPGVPGLSDVGRQVYQAGKGAAEITRDAFQGVDPSTDPAAIGKVAEAAAIVAPGSRIPSLARRAAVPAGPPSVAKTKIIDEAADAGYDAVRKSDWGVEVAGKELYDKIRKPLKEEAPGEAVAGPVFDKLKLLKKADTFKDVLEVRQAVGEIARTGKGSERETAKVAKQMLTKELDDLIPGTAEKLAIADRNKAVAKNARKIEKKAEGELTEKSFNKEAATAAEKPYTSEAERLAYENYTKPSAGSRLLKAASYADPIKHPWMGAGLLGLTGGSSLMAAPAGYGARKLYERGMRNRAGDISMAIRSQAPAGYLPGRLGSPERTIGAVRNSLLPPASYYPLGYGLPPRRED